MKTHGTDVNISCSPEVWTAAPPHLGNKTHRHVAASSRYSHCAYIHFRWKLKIPRVHKPNVSKLGCLMMRRKSGRVDSSRPLRRRSHFVRTAGRAGNPNEFISQGLVIYLSTNMFNFYRSKIINQAKSCSGPLHKVNSPGRTKGAASPIMYVATVIKATWRTAMEVFNRCGSPGCLKFAPSFECDAPANHVGDVEKTIKWV